MDAEQRSRSARALQGARPLAGAERARMNVTQTNTGEKAMRTRLFFVPVLLFALACSGFAQLDHPQIKNKPDAPLQITEAHCSQTPLGSPPQGSYYSCRATAQFADAKETWDAYELLWTITFEDGSKSILRQSADRSLPTPGEKAGTPFKPREIVNTGNPGNGGAGLMVKDRDRKPLRPTGAQVEVEFVVKTNGTVWGDSKSPSYQMMLEHRKQGKKGADR